MTRKFLFLVSLFLGCSLAGSIRAAEPANAGEERLREALRDSMLQLRAAQAELGTLKAAEATAAQEKKALSEKYEALKKQVAADRSVTDKSLGGLAAQTAEQKNTIARLTETLAQTKAEGEKAAQAARVAEAQGVKLTALNGALDRRVGELETKNLALYMLGNQILTRYEEFGLGNAIKAKEPFVGLTRTKLENLVQEYQDKLLDERVRPGEATAGR